MIDRIAVPWIAKTGTVRSSSAFFPRRGLQKNDLSRVIVSRGSRERIHQSRIHGTARVGRQPSIFYLIGHDGCGDLSDIAAGPCFSGGIDRAVHGGKTQRREDGDDADDDQQFDQGECLLVGAGSGGGRVCHKNGSEVGDNSVVLKSISPSIEEKGELFLSVVFLKMKEALVLLLSCEASESQLLQETLDSSSVRITTMDDVSAATQGQVYQRDQQTGYNDAGWNIEEGNYERWITQINPDLTSIGLFRVRGNINSNSSKYDRFARSFQNSSGKNTMYFKFHSYLYEPSTHREYQSKIIQSRFVGVLL